MAGTEARLYRAMVGAGVSAGPLLISHAWLGIGMITIFGSPNNPDCGFNIAGQGGGKLDELAAAWVYESKDGSMERLAFQR